LVSLCRDAACDPSNRVAGRREVGAAACGSDWRASAISEGSRENVNVGWVSKFIRQILTDGTYELEIMRIGKEDPDLASM